MFWLQGKVWYSDQMAGDQGDICSRNLTLSRSFETLCKFRSKFSTFLDPPPIFPTYSYFIFPKFPICPILLYISPLAIISLLSLWLPSSANHKSQSKLAELRGHSLTACNAALSATPHRPLTPKWPTGSGNRLNLRLLEPLINFSPNKFLDLIIPSMRASKIQNSHQGA